MGDLGVPRPVVFVWPSGGPPSGGGPRGPDRLAATHTCLGRGAGKLFGPPPAMGPGKAVRGPKRSVGQSVRGLIGSLESAKAEVELGGWGPGSGRGGAVSDARLVALLQRALQTDADPVVRRSAEELLVPNLSHNRSPKGLKKAPATTFDQAKARVLAATREFDGKAAFEGANSAGTGAPLAGILPPWR
mmetsp:Transcript_71164/g.161063  ORF Transcript_71164/g.161063 Transcript_71164/m.161063 type:complete len:189 (-) Transcript_71164:117-683(-)